MDRVGIRVLVREISLVKTTHVPDAVIDLFLDEGYNKIISRKKWSWLLQPLEVITPTAGVFDLSTLDARFLGVDELDHEGTPLSVIPKSQLNFFRQGHYSSTRPWAYRIERNNLVIVPETTDPFNLSYFGDVGWTVGDDQVPGEIPDHWHPALVNWAIHRIWEREEDFDKSDAYLTKFEMDLGNMAYEDNSRDSDTPKIYGQAAYASRRTTMPWLDGA